VTSADSEADAGPLQVRGTVLTVRRVDAYHAMTVVAPGIAARFRPGQFVAVAVGGPHEVQQCTPRRHGLSLEPGVGRDVSRDDGRRRLEPQDLLDRLRHE